jgi:GTPase
LHGEVDVREESDFFLGPVESGDFVKVRIATIHQQKRAVLRVRARQVCSFQIHGDSLDTIRIRKGMFILKESDVIPQGIREFEVDLSVDSHSGALFPGYQGILHSGAIRQEAKITWMEKECMRKGERGKVRFMFVHDPEYVKLGTLVLFRGQKTRCAGRIIKVCTGCKLKEQ